MKKKKVLLLLLILIPVTVNAGVICNDGWEDSSCEVSGPGCCSHHDGVKKNNSNYNYSNSEISYQDYLNQKEKQETMLWIGGIGLFTGFIIFGIVYSKYDEKKRIKIIERREEERERLINEQKQKKESEIIGDDETSVCGNCDKEVPSDAEICPYCGVEFEIVDTNETSVCGNCDREVPSDAEICPYCGAEFETQENNEKEDYSSILPYH